jgi:hypothetical protein
MGTFLSELATVTDYINDSRVLLQDLIAPYRYDDPSLLTALNLTLFEARRIRPDLFVLRRRAPGEQEVPQFNQNQGQPVPMEYQFRLGVLHGMTGYALERDQEDNQDIRAQMFLKTFSDILTGTRQIAGAGAQAQ